MDSNSMGNFSGNNTEEYLLITDDYHRNIGGRVIGCLITLLIAFLAIIGNIAVVVVSFQSETLRSQTGNILVVYLSTIDILTALFVMLPSAISVAFDYWPLGDIMCHFHAICNYTFAASSSVNLAVISVDRAIAIAYPFKYRSTMTTKVMLKLCCFILLNGLFFGILCGWPEWVSYNYSEAACAMDYADKFRVFYIFTVGCILCFYIPLVVLSASNAFIIFIARKSGKSKRTFFIRRDNAKSSITEAVESDNHMKKTIKSLVVVILTYYLCFSPYALFKQMKVHLDIDMAPQLNYLSSIFIFISSATNPFIYAILRKDYRDAFKRLVKILTKKFTR